MAEIPYARDACAAPELDQVLQYKCVGTGQSLGSTDVLDLYSMQENVHILVIGFNLGGRATWPEEAQNAQEVHRLLLRTEPNLPRRGFTRWARIPQNDVP